MKANSYLKQILNKFTVYNLKSMLRNFVSLYKISFALNCTYQIPVTGLYKVQFLCLYGLI